MKFSLDLHQSAPGIDFHPPHIEDLPAMNMNGLKSHLSREKGSFGFELEKE